jgi:hypothetical protein
VLVSSSASGQGHHLGRPLPADAMAPRLGLAAGRLAGGDARNSRSVTDWLVTRRAATLVTS